MASIKALTDRSGKQFYPQTITSAVYDREGRGLDALLEQTVTAEEDEYDSEAAELPEYRRLFVDMWNSAATVGGKVYGRYNEDTGFFELNGITDITYAEALKIMQYAPLCRDGNNDKIGLLSDAPYNYLRAVWPINVFKDGDGMGLRVMAAGCLNLETIVFYGCRTTGIACTDFYAPFYNCQRLRVIDGSIDVSRISGGQLAGAFELCKCLEEVRLTRLKTSVDFRWTPYLSLATLQFIVENAVNTAAITVTVHADVYAKLADAGNEEWHALVGAAADKNITFVKP